VSERRPRVLHRELEGGLSAAGPADEMGSVVVEGVERQPQGLPLRDSRVLGVAGKARGPEFVVDRLHSDCLVAGGKPFLVRDPREPASEPTRNEDDGFPLAERMMVQNPGFHDERPPSVVFCAQWYPAAATGHTYLGVVNSEGLSDAQYLATSGRARFASLRLGVA
jgi:hypothetical protein